MVAAAVGALAMEAMAVALAAATAADDVASVMSTEGALQITVTAAPTETSPAGPVKRLVARYVKLSCLILFCRLSQNRLFTWMVFDGFPFERSLFHY